LVDQIPLETKVYALWAAGEHDESGRPDGGLGHEAQLNVRVDFQRLNESIQLARGDALRRRFITFADRLEQRFDAGARLRRHKHDRRVIQKLELIANLLDERVAALLRGDVPLVDTDDQSAAFFVRVPGNGGVGSYQSLTRIHHQHDDVGHADVFTRHHHAELFRHLVRLAFAANAGGVDEDVVDIVAFDDFVHRIARRAGHRRNDGPLAARERVQQRRLADV